MKKSIIDFENMKKKGDVISYITAYDYPISMAVEKAGIDLILVGDSGGMVQYGYTSTNPVVMEESLLMCN